MYSAPSRSNSVCFCRSACCTSMESMMVGSVPSRRFASSDGSLRMMSKLLRLRATDSSFLEPFESQNLTQKDLHVKRRALKNRAKALFLYLRTLSRNAEDFFDGCEAVEDLQDAVLLHGGHSLVLCEFTHLIFRNLLRHGSLDFVRHGENFVDS